MYRKEVCYFVKPVLFFFLGSEDFVFFSLKRDLTVQYAEQ